MASGREVVVPPERVAGWIARFAERHGQYAAAWADRSLLLTAADGETARLSLPGNTPWPVHVDGSDDADDPVTAFVQAAIRSRVLGLLLIRRGGYSVGVAAGAAIIAHRSGSRYLQGRTAAGGWSQQRFARRRANQAKAGLDKAREAIVDVVLPRVGDLDEVVSAGERQAVREVLSAPELQDLNGLLRQDMLPSGPATFAALGDLLTRARSVGVVIGSGPEGVLLPGDQPRQESP
jgi:Actinobacteria/chloroflexi VLRF1 release factor